MVEIDLQNPRHVGVDGEQDLSVWGRGNQAVGSLAAAIVSLTDQDSTDGIPIRVNDDLLFFDNPDSRLPTTRIEIDGRRIRQRDHVIQTLRSALESMEGMSGDTNARARAIADFLPRLENALYSNPNTTLDLTAIITILRERGLSLSEIAAASGTPGEGDAVIRSLLREINLDPIQFETRDGMASALDELERADTIEDIEGNAAWQQLGNLPASGPQLTSHNQSVIDEARARLTRLRAEQAAAESEAEAEPAITAADLGREISQASLENLQSIVRDSDRRELLRGHSELREALTDRVHDLIVADSTISAQAIRDLTPYMALEPGQAIISFLQGDQQHVAIITRTERAWAFEGNHFNDLRIEIDDGSLVVREDRIFGRRFRTAVIATRDSVAGRATEQTLFNLGVSMERIDAGLGNREASHGEVRPIGDSRGINAALFRRIDRDGNGRLSDEELEQFNDMVNRYAIDHGISADRAYELYRTSTSFVLDNFAARGVARDRIILELTEGNDDSEGIDFLTLATMDSDEARIALASDLEGLGYDQQVIAAALDQHEGSYQNITAEMMASYLIRISSAAMHGTEFFNVETSIPEFPSGLITTRTIITYLHGEDYDEPLSLGSATDVRAAARRLERDPRYRELFYNVTHYRNIGNWVRLAADLAGTLMDSDNPDDHQIAELLPQILEIYGGPEYAASVLSHDSGYNSTMADALMADRQYRRAYEYAINISRTGQRDDVLARLLDSCVAALPEDGEQAGEAQLNRTEILEIALDITSREGIQTRRREHLQAVAQAAVGFRGEQADRNRWQQELISEDGQISEASLQAFSRVQEIRRRGLDLYEEVSRVDREFEIRRGNEEVPISEFLRQERNRLRRPIEIQMLSNLVFPGTEGEAIHIQYAEAAVRRLDAIISSAATAESEMERDEIRIHAFTLIAQIRRAQGQEVWTIRPNQRPDEQEQRESFRYFIEASQAARMATLLSMEARNRCRGESDPEIRALSSYFDELHVESNTIIARIIIENRTIWWNDQRNDHGAGEFLRNVRANFRRLFAVLARYFPDESWAHNLDRETRDTTPRISAEQIRTWVNIRGSRSGRQSDDEHPRTTEYGFYTTEELNSYESHHEVRETDTDQQTVRRTTRRRVRPGSAGGEGNTVDQSGAGAIETGGPAPTIGQLRTRLQRIRSTDGLNDAQRAVLQSHQSRLEQIAQAIDNNTVSDPVRVDRALSIIAQQIRAAGPNGSGETTEGTDRQPGSRDPQVLRTARVVQQAIPAARGENPSVQALQRLVEARSAYLAALRAADPNDSRIAREERNLSFTQGRLARAQGRRPASPTSRPVAQPRPTSPPTRPARSAQPASDQEAIWQAEQAANMDLNGDGNIGRPSS